MVTASNTAMACHDATMQAEGDRLDYHSIANDAASRFMKICFDVETKNTKE